MTHTICFFLILFNIQINTTKALAEKSLTTLIPLVVLTKIDDYINKENKNSSSPTRSINKLVRSSELRLLKGNFDILKWFFIWMFYVTPIIYIV